jgi:hypothetical protein
LVDHKYPPAVTCLLTYPIGKEKKAKERQPVWGSLEHRLDRPAREAASDLRDSWPVTGTFQSFPFFENPRSKTFAYASLGNLGVHLSHPASESTRGRRKSTFHLLQRAAKIAYILRVTCGMSWRLWHAESACSGASCVGCPQGIPRCTDPDPLTGVSSDPECESSCEPMRERWLHPTASNTDLISIRVYCRDFSLWDFSRICAMIESLLGK